MFSRLYGNYGGLASSDENGRTAPNVSRYYDSLFLSFDQKGNEALGRLNTDRPIQFKLQGSYRIPWGTTLGVNLLAMSGLLQSSTVTYQGVPIYFNGRGDLGRMPAYSQTDLLINHDFRLGGNRLISLQMNVSNLFDQETGRPAWRLPPIVTRSSFPISRAVPPMHSSNPAASTRRRFRRRGSRLLDGRHRPTTRRISSRAHARSA